MVTRILSSTRLVAVHMSNVQTLLGLNQLERDALVGCEPDVLRRHVERVMKHYSVEIGNPSLTPMYRARRNEASRLFNHVTELWYPPAKFVSPGRLNAANNPLLYASSEVSVALAELKPKANDIVTVLEIKNHDSLARAKCVTISHLSHFDRTKKSLYPRGTFFTRETISEMIGAKTYKRSVCIDRTIGNWFATDGDTFYSLTGATADFYFKIPNLDGIVYPAVAWGEGLNVALKPESADRLFVPSQAYAIQITNPDAREGECGGTYVAVSKEITADGTIRWS